MDQIVEQYIEPMNDLVNAVVAHRKFINGPFDEVQRALINVRTSHAHANM